MTSNLVRRSLPKPVFVTHNRYRSSAPKGSKWSKLEAQNSPQSHPQLALLPVLNNTHLFLSTGNAALRSQACFKNSDRHPDCAAISAE